MVLNTFVMIQDGKTALMIAAEFGKTEVVVELVKAGADLNLQDRVSLYLSYIPLYLSLHALLLASGASPPSHVNRPISICMIYVMGTYIHTIALYVSSNLCVHFAHHNE